MQCPCGKRCSHANFWGNSPECQIAFQTHWESYEIPYDFKLKIKDFFDDGVSFHGNREARRVLKDGIDVVIYECLGCGHQVTYFSYGSVDKKMMTRINIEGECE